MSQPQSTSNPAPAKKRGPKRSLTQERIIDTALGVLDADGIGAVTIRRLANELDVNPMTLYSYFETKDDLLEALAARVLESMVARRNSKLSWDEQVSELARRMHMALSARPGIADLLLARHLRGPGLDDIREQVVSTLRSGGLDATEIIDSTRLLFNFVLASAIAETAREATTVATLEIDLDSERQPVLTELGADYVDRGAGSSFEFGLTQIMDSLRRLAEAK